jgi:hypothetical protein
MIDHILNFHMALEKGQYVKIITSLNNYITYINRTDLIKAEDNILVIFRANGANVVLNTDYVVGCCIVKERL